MRRKPKKSELVLIGALGATILFVVSLDSQVKRKRAVNRAARGAAQNPVQVSSSPADTRIRPFFAATAGELAPSWGGDPFDRPFTRHTDTGGGKRTRHVQSTPDTRLHLFGVIVGGGGAAALIGDRQLARGDTVGAYVVKSISRNRVVLENMTDRSKRVLRVR